jgi:hypothetical protein
MVNDMTEDYEELLMNLSARSDTYSLAATIAIRALIGERDKLLEAAKSVIESRLSTYKAGNGRQVGIQDENGEKCWIVPFDEMWDLERAVIGETR